MSGVRADDSVPSPRGSGRRPEVAVVSVRGRPGLATDALARLEDVASVRVLARGERPALTREEAVDVLAGAEVVGLTPKVTPPMDDWVLGRLPELRAVALHATGTDMYDLDLFARHGVGLAVLPDYSTTSVAEHALAMLLSLSSRVHLANDRSRGTVPQSTSLRGFELAGRTLGVVGYGRVGRRVAGLAAAFGMSVVATDVRPLSADGGAAAVPLPTLLERSDVVVVCSSRRHDDPPVLGPAELDRMRHGAALVVVSRAVTVDTGAALAAVRSGRLRGYAVDDVVVDPDQHGDLLREGRVIQTGHRAWWNDEVLDRGATEWVDALRGLVIGEPVALAVPPTRPGHRRASQADRGR